MKHIATPGIPGSMCGQTGGELVTLEEALHEDGRNFDCVDCLKILRGGQKHARPITETEDDE